MTYMNTKPKNESYVQGQGVVEVTDNVGLILMYTSQYFGIWGWLGCDRGSNYWYLRFMGDTRAGCKRLQRKLVLQGFKTNRSY